MIYLRGAEGSLWDPQFAEAVLRKVQAREIRTVAYPDQLESVHLGLHSGCGTLQVPSPQVADTRPPLIVEGSVEDGSRDSGDGLLQVH